MIAHSLGSVVTYEALWQEPRIDVDLFVTLGSPLAMPHAVQPRLEPCDDAKPPGVKRWVNIADAGDLIAIPVHGISTHFTGVDADVHATIHAFDFHLVANYLATPQLAAELRAETD